MPKLTTRFDVTEAQIKKFKLGEKVDVRLRGTIKELTASRVFEFALENEKGRRAPPSIEIEISSTKITGSNEFSDLAEDGDDG